MTEYGAPYHPTLVPAPTAMPTPRSPVPVISLVISILALVGVLVLAVLLAGSGALGGGRDAPLTGQVSSTGGSLQGQVLAQDLTQVISDDGGDVSDLRCPDTAAVEQGVSTICHGTISGSAWAVAVFFEDDRGRFTALPM